MNLSVALEWAATRKDGVLITLRSDGRAQSSDIVYAVVDGLPVISVTKDRAKTRNMERDPRVVLHISDRTSWSYVSIDGVAQLGPVTAEPSDEASDALAAYYTAVTGEAHRDWDEYRAAMVEQQRLLVTIEPHSVVGQIRN